MEHWTREHGYRILRGYLKNIYEPFYAMNDAAHQIDHVVGVCDLALEINSAQKLFLDEQILVGAAMTHDLFNHSRANHHELAKNYIMNNGIDWLSEFDREERSIMGCAAGEHRASYKGEYTSIYSQVIASADRGTPDVESAIIRCAVFGSTKGGFAGESLYVHVINHMKDKFGTKGYSKYPEIYKLHFGDKIREFNETMDNIDNKLIDEIVSDHPIYSKFKEPSCGTVRLKVNQPYKSL